MKKKNKRKEIRKKALTLAKVIAKRRDNYICQKTGKEVTGSNCHGSHVIPVSRDNRLALDPINILTLDSYSHLRWWHKDILEAYEWFRETFPERFKYLERKRKENQTKGTFTLLELSDTYKDLLELSKLSNEEIEIELENRLE